MQWGDMLRLIGGAELLKPGDPPISPRDIQESCCLLSGDGPAGSMSPGVRQGREVWCDAHLSDESRAAPKAQQ